MINKIFVFILLVGLIYAGFTDRADLAVAALLSAPKEAFFLFIDIYVLLIFWGGILQICKDSGLLKVLSTWIIYIIHPLFKKLDKNDVALQYISMNFLANFLSMGSAATPFGLEAMKRLDELNNHSEVASDEMITFLIVNTSGLCLIPTTLIAIRNEFKSSNSVIIVPYILVISTIITFLAIYLDRMVRKHAKH